MKTLIDQSGLSIAKALTLYKYAFKQNPTFGINIHSENFVPEDIVTLQKEEAIRTSGTPIKLDFFALCLCLEGKSIRKVNQYEFQIEKYSLQLIPAGSLFSFESITEQTQLYFILFTEPFIQAYNNKHVSQNIASLFEYHKENIDHIILASNIYNRVKTIFEDINTELLEKKDDYTMIIKLLILKLLFILKRTKVEKCQAFPKCETRPEQIANHYLDLVEKYFMQFKKVSDYAILLNITPKHLTETINETLNINALSCIHNRILKESLYLLEYTSFNINQIASSLNFNTPSDFSRFFARYCHMSPKEYRLRMQK
jgi:AraC family transcriptional regulator, transcriptional activator of pobA